MSDDGCCAKYGCCARITCMIFTAIGLAFSILTVQSCEFVEFSGTISGRTGGATGLFKYQDANGNCVRYPDDVNIGGTDNAARTCGALAALFGLIALVLIMWEFFICKLCCARCIESTVYAVAYICQACTYLFYNNSTLCTAIGTSCSWGNGSTWSIIAFGMYFISSCIMCCAPRSEPLCCKSRQARKEAQKEKEIREDQQQKDQAAYDAEQGKSGDSSPVASGDDKDADDAAHASAY